MSYFEFFPSELVCFSRNPVRLNILCFPHYFPAFTPPRSKFNHFYIVISYILVLYFYCSLKCVFLFVL